MTHLNVWAPLAVALAVAAITAVGSYVTARHTTSKANRAELLAAKRTAYADFLSTMDNASWHHKASLGRIDLKAPVFQEMHVSLAQLELLASPEVVDLVRQTKGTSKESHPLNFWKKDERAEVVAAMQTDLRADEESIR